MTKNFDMQAVAEQIKAAKSVLLTTHKQCDGDGLGAQLAIYHALKKTQISVRVLCVDEVPQKYNFLNPKLHLETFDQPHTPLEPTDLALIFDTNDRRLVEPLYSALKSQCKKILFIDHHPVLSQGPQPTEGSIIFPDAASTGELAYFLIKALKIDLDPLIAEALYTSIVFDTQIFRYVKNSRNSHLIAAELLEHVSHPQSIHQKLFATHSKQKMNFLSQVLGKVQYHEQDQLALLKLNRDDLDRHGLEMDDSRDVIDMMMNIHSLQVSALFRQEDGNHFKVSLRSKGPQIVDIAEELGGGGHAFAAGAYVEQNYQDLEKFVLKRLKEKLT